MISMADQAEESTRKQLLDAFDVSLPLSKLNALVRKWRALDKSGAGLECGKPIKVAVLANYSSQFLCGGLMLALGQHGFHAEIFEGGYNQIEMDLLNPDGALRAFHPDVILISLTTTLLALRDTETRPAEVSAQLSDVIETARETFRARIVLTLPEPLEEERHSGAWSIAWRREFCDTLRERLASTCVLVDMEPLIRKVGSDNWFAGRLYVTQKLTAHPDQTARISDYLGQHIAAAVSRPVRLVAVDLDNTLWGGVVGEVGWQGVDLDPEGKGLAHLKLQRFLLDLHEKGVLIVAVSKNNLQDALDVFDNRPEMILQREHFADMMINWNPKSQNIQASLANLNLTPTGTAFIDDNPVERAEVQSMMPDVHVPDFPADMIDLVPALCADGRFLIPGSTEEDKNRQQFYRTESKRLRAKTEATDLSGFYDTLGLRLRPQAIDANNMNRVLDLIAKTNQFNLTGVRHGASTVEKILAMDGAIGWTYQLNDKFGDYGLISVVLGVPEGDALAIETWVLSCRAMGRTVEHGIINHLFRSAAEYGYKELKGVFVPLKRNQPVADLYSKLGFGGPQTSPDGRRVYHLPLAGQPPATPHVEVA